MNRTSRISSIIKILSDYPNKPFNLSYFCKAFNASKSTISEDVTISKSIVAETEFGVIRTVKGVNGGVVYTPSISNERCIEVQKSLCHMLDDPSRILGGGFLYTSDIMFDPNIAKQLAPIFVRKFAHLKPDYVVTIETKGIPLAFTTASLMNIPTVVVRRETKISEGPTVSINYFSGSTDRIQKMSMAKKATKPGTKALVIDDFMRAGGSLRGIVELLGEFSVDVCGIGVAISSLNPERKKVNEFTPIIFLGDVDEDSRKITVTPNSHIFP